MPSSHKNINYLFMWLLREIYLSWRFISRDISTTIIPGVLYSIAARLSISAPSFDLIVIGQGILYFWLYIYLFCLSNQITGIDEDRHNKPDRPLIDGTISLRGAKRRWVISVLAFVYVGLAFGVIEWAALWLITVLLYDHARWSRHWFTKNLCMSIGTVAQLAAAWQLVTPITLMAWTWIIVIAVSVFPLVGVQDLRDIDGDHKIGRRTFPIAFGEHASRLFICICFFLITPCICFFLGNTLGVIGFLCGSIITMLSSVISWRIIRVPTGDHRTYMLFTYWYCALLSMSIISIVITSGHI